MRACAREVGMAAIQAASVERSLEVDHLAGERRAVLAALAGDGARSCDEIAAGERSGLARSNSHTSPLS